MTHARVGWAWSVVLAVGCAPEVASEPFVVHGDDDGGREVHRDAGASGNDLPDDPSPGDTDPTDGASSEDGDGAADSDGSAGAPGDPSHACCADGDCLCHGYSPTALTSDLGPFQTAELTLPLGTVTYPVDAEPPFAALALCGGFFNAGPEMAEWAPFYASHGIVTMITTTAFEDLPQNRADKLLAALDQLVEEHETADSPLFGKLALDRLGTSGFSMGGGGTTLASVGRPTLRSSVALAPWGPATVSVTVPTLLLCGTADTVAPCSFAQDAYAGMDDTVPKLLVELEGWVHLPDWYGPQGPGTGLSGKFALAFEKVFLEGDQRWLDVLTAGAEGADVTTTLP